MKTKPLFIAMAAALAVAIAPLCAEDAKPEMMNCSMKEHDAKKHEMEKMRAMEATMKAEAAEFDKLIDEMNASTGDRKIAAVAAVLNKMAQKQKEMKAKCDAMMHEGMVKKDGKSESKPQLDYYTCSMHPAVHWPVPGKCPLCSMELVPVFKKVPKGNSEAVPAPKVESKQDEQPNKADDPHAGHH